MNEPGGEERLDFEIDLDGADETAANARLVAEQFDNLGDEASQAARRLAKLDAQSKLTGTEMELLAAKVKVAAMAIDDERNRVSLLAIAYEEQIKLSKKMRREVVEETTALERLTAVKKKAGKATAGFLGWIKKSNAAMFTTLKVVGLLTLGLTILGAIAQGGALIPGLVALVSALAPLLAFSALAPTAIGGLVASMATLMVAFKGVGEAIGAGFSDDFEAYYQALNKLSPATAKFVRELVGFAPGLRGIKREIQESFFGPLVSEVKPLFKSLLPVVAEGTRGLATSFSGVFGVVTRWLRSASGMRAVQAMFQAGKSWADHTKRGLGPFLNAISRLMVAVAPFWERLMTNTEHMFLRFSAWINAIVADGRLNAWMDRAFTAASDLWRILRDTGRIIMALGKGFEGNALTKLANWLGKVADWMNSDRGQAEIIEFFRELASIAKVLYPMWAIFGEAIFNVLMPALERITVGAGPGFLYFLEKVSENLAKIDWEQAGRALGDIMAITTLLLPILGGILNFIINVVDSDFGKVLLVIAAAFWLVHGGVVALRAAMFLLELATAAYQVVQWAANAAAYAFPGTWLVVIILAVIAAIVLLIVYWDEVTAFFSSAWNLNLAIIRDTWNRLVKLIADGVIATQTLFGIVYDFLTQPFVAAYNFINETFIKPIREALTGLLDPLAGFTNGSWNPVDWNWGGARAEGGPVQAGLSYLTGERGHEIFLGNDGSMQNLGLNGMEMFEPKQPGLIVPNHMVTALQDIEASVRAGFRRDMAQTNEAVLASAGTRRGGDSQVIDQRQYNAPISVYPQADIDVESAVERAFDRMKRDDEERGY